MSLLEEINTLRQMSVFDGVPYGKLELLALYGRRVPYVSGDILFEQEDPPDNVHVVVSGALDVFRETDSGQVPLASLGEGALFGEIGALCGRSRSATVKAASDAVVLQIKRDVFVEFVANAPQVAMAIIEELSSRLDATNRKLAQVSVSV